MRVSDEKGIALLLSLFLIVALSVVAGSLMFLAQTETYSSLNYRLMSQARYGAEAGLQRAANHLMYSYTAPTATGTDAISAYNYVGVSPVTYNGQPVVL
jgi:type II secretory pathway component PulK